MSLKKICVIGAGISGLVVAKHLIEEGYDVKVFERQIGLGGVWGKENAYPGLKTQNTGDTYHFSDYPIPDDYPEFPSAEHIRAYLQSYAEEFNIIQNIYFQTEIVNISRVKETGWEVKIRRISGEYPYNSQEKNNLGSNLEETHHFDFVVICNGTFSQPNIPQIPGMDIFIAAGGQILHTTKFKNISQATGKNVVVVGFGKSATEIATIISQHTKNCYIVYRRALWKIPKVFFNKIHYKELFLTRFSFIWTNYRKKTPLEQRLHSFGKPLVWAFWRINELIFSSHLQLDKSKMVPEIPMDKFLTCAGNLVSDGFYESVISGQIQAKQSSINRFTTDGIELASGEFIAADMVILGTGFKAGISFLESKYRQKIIDNEGHFHLYRNILHPDVPNMAFIGYASSFFNPLSSEVSTWWLMEYLRGSMKLPAANYMHQEITEQLQWLKDNMFDSTVGNCTAPYSFQYLEELIEDMGIKVTGKDGIPIQGMMEVLKPSAYQKIRQTLLAQTNKTVRENREISTTPV